MWKKKCHHVLVADFKHVPECMGQPSYLWWGFQTGALVNLSQGIHSFIDQLFLADGAHCKASAFHSPIHYQNSFLVKSVPWIQMMLEYPDGVNIEMVVLAEAM